MADELPVLVSSDAWRNGLCAVFDGEAVCMKPRGADHGLHHRFRDPSGSARWVEKDVLGVEVARGPGTDGAWMSESPLRRREHHFLPQSYPGEDVDRTPHLRDVGRCCGLVRASAVHTASEATRVAAEAVRGAPPTVGHAWPAQWGDLPATLGELQQLLDRDPQPAVPAVETIAHQVAFSRETLEDAPALAPAFAELLAGTRMAPTPEEPAGPPAWDARRVYMAALHDVVRWANRELDRAQLGEPATETRQVRGLVDGLDDARRGYGVRDGGILDE